MQTHQLKIAGIIAGVVVVVGVISLLALLPAGVQGISADVLQPTGYALIPKTDWQTALDNLKLYPISDQATQSQIIQEVIQILESAQTN
jgi:hypothetical protein